MDDMKQSQWICWAALGAWLGVGCAQAATYYINDSSTEADVYCTAAGNSVNTGLTPESPKDSWANLVTAIALAPGDMVYFDTGTYEGYTAIEGCSGARMVRFSKTPDEPLACFIRSIYRWKMSN